MSVETVPLARSYLFVPGTRPERFAKAHASGADQVILDLEDSVAPDAKDSARAAVSSGLDPRYPALVRINAHDTPYFEQDLELVKHPGVRGLMIPKAEHLPAQLVAACRKHQKVLLPLIETAQGFANMETIARTAGVERLVFGSIDFQLDLEIDGIEVLDMFRPRFTLVSRLAGLAAPIDGVTLDILNKDLLRRDAVRARSFGFAGKLCIHPVQVGLVNEIMSPSEQQLSWARAVVAAADRTDAGVLQVNGQMIDKPVIARARRWLSRR